MQNSIITYIVPNKIKLIFTYFVKIVFVWLLFNIKIYLVKMLSFYLLTLTHLKFILFHFVKSNIEINYLQMLT